MKKIRFSQLLVNFLKWGFSKKLSIFSQLSNFFLLRVLKKKNIYIELIEKKLLSCLSLPLEILKKLTKTQKRLIK